MAVPTDRSMEPRGPWRVDPHVVIPLRGEVLRPGSPLERSAYPGDGHPLAVHLAAFQGDDPVACGTVLPDGDRWRIRGMATREPLRGRGLGGAILEGLLAGVAERGGGVVWCNARADVASFYQARGFRTGGTADDPGDGVARVRLERRVQPATPHAASAEPVDILRRTPTILTAWFEGAEAWADVPEGPGLWSSRDVLAHLLHNEGTDWLPRIRHILAHGGSRPFKPFERLGGDRRYAGWSVPRLLEAFREARAASLAEVQSEREGWDPEATGLHPVLGPVSVGQLMAGWAAHDLSHLAQLARIRARPLASDVGPFAAYMRVFHAPAERAFEPGAGSADSDHG
jgi:GNAT superfamily N-acetyltransferase